MKNSRNTIYILVLVVILGIVLRVLANNDFLIEPDSYIYMNNFSAGIACNKPLYCLLSWVFGGSEISLRLISLLSSIILIPVMCLAGKKYFGKFAGLSAAILTAISIHEIVWSNQIMPDILATLFLALFLIKIDKPYSFIFIVIASLVRPEYLIILPLVLIYKREKKHLVLYAFLFLILVAYFLFSNQVHITLINFYKYPEIFATLIALEPATTVLAILPLVLSKDKKYYFFAMIFIVLGLIYYWQNPENWRYTLNLVVPLVIMASFGLKILINKIRQNSIWAPIVIGVLVVIFIYQISAVFSLFQ